jgi:hypothetical protein
MTGTIGPAARFDGSTPSWAVRTGSGLTAGSPAAGVEALGSSMAVRVPVTTALAAPALATT